MLIYSTEHHVFFSVAVTIMILIFFCLIDMALIKGYDISFQFGKYSVKYKYIHVL